MSDTDRGQVSASAAEVYDAFFVPALFDQWTDVVLDVADVRSGHRVLDVGCGTGVLARAAHARVGAHGHVAGVDPNDGMLTIARQAGPDIEWQTGLAEQLPYPDHSFDRTVSQFALMYFTDPEGALSEICRVTRPEGQVALAVWDRLDNNRGYARLATLVEELFGSDAADAIRVPFHDGRPRDAPGPRHNRSRRANGHASSRRRPIRNRPQHGSTPRSVAGRSPTASTTTGSPRCSTPHRSSSPTSSQTAVLPSTCPHSSSAAPPREHVDEPTRSAWSRSPPRSDRLQRPS